MKKFLKVLFISYIGSAAGCIALLALSGLWERGGSFFQALPGAFVLQLTFGLPWFLGSVAAIALFYKEK